MFGIEVIETSAKNALNIELVMEKITKQLIKRQYIYFNFNSEERNKEIPEVKGRKLEKEGVKSKKNNCCEKI